MRKSLLRMTFRQLQVFRSVCDQRSYSRAAEEMSLTQPAVSLQIRQLEELLGQRLRHRQAQPDRLLAAGSHIRIENAGGVVLGKPAAVVTDFQPDRVAKSPHDDPATRASINSGRYIRRGPELK